MFWFVFRFCVGLRCVAKDQSSADEAFASLSIAAGVVDDLELKLKQVTTSHYARVNVSSPKPKSSKKQKSCDPE